MAELVGVIVDSITPRGKQGEADLGAVLDLVDYYCAAGVRGIVLFGTAGEYPAFGIDERARVTYLAVKRSRVPVFTGAGSANLNLSLDLAREARDAGSAGVLLPPPLGVRYEPEDVREFYLQFARQMEQAIPVFLTNVPTISGPIPPETAAELLDTGLFAGIVDSAGDLGCIGASTGPQFVNANDALFTAARRAGCRCVISETACAVPELLVALDCAIERGRGEHAAKLDQALQEFVCWIRRFPAPAVLQTATALRGKKTGPVTAPLSAAKQKLLAEFRAWFEGWMPAVKRLCADA